MLFAWLYVCFLAHFELHFEAWFLSMLPCMVFEHVFSMGYQHGLQHGLLSMFFQHGFQACFLGWFIGMLPSMVVLQRGLRFLCSARFISTLLQQCEHGIRALFFQQVLNHAFCFPPTSCQRTYRTKSINANLHMLFTWF